MSETHKKTAASRNNRPQRNEKTKGCLNPDFTDGVQIASVRQCTDSIRQDDRQQETYPYVNEFPVLEKQERGLERDMGAAIGVLYGDKGTDTAFLVQGLQTLCG